jgi:hypothetical protein
MSGFFCPDTKRKPADYAANVPDIASGSADAPDYNSHGLVHSEAQRAENYGS